MLYPIDLGFLGFERAIGVYVVETADGPALFDCGPATTLPRLEEGLRERGLELADIRHLLLSHIHLDHAGAAGPIVREHPGLTVWVSEVGAPHLVDPSRLEASARRLYGDVVRPALGRARARARARTSAIADGRRPRLGGLPDRRATPRTTSATSRDGTLLAGDACGVRIQPARYIVPPSPPPDIDLEAWHAHDRDDRAAAGPSGSRSRTSASRRDVGDHLDRLEAELDRLGGARARRDGPGGVRRRRGGLGRRRSRALPGSRRLRPVLAGAPAVLGQARRARPLGRRLTGRLSPRAGGLGRRSTGRSTSPRARRRPCAAGR